MIEEKDLHDLRMLVMGQEYKKYKAMFAETLDALWIIINTGKITPEQMKKYRTVELIRNMRAWLVNNGTKLTMVLDGSGDGTHILAYRNDIGKGNHTAKRGTYTKVKGGKYSWR